MMSTMSTTTPLGAAILLLVLMTISVSAQHKPASSESHHHRQQREDGDDETQGLYTLPRGGGTGGHRRGNSRGHGRGHTAVDQRLRSGSLQHNSQRGGRVNCAQGTFLNRSTGRCIDCALCPMNEIIRRPCGVHRDTVCGPFYEFKPGHGGGSNSLAQYQTDQRSLQGSSSQKHQSDSNENVTDLVSSEDNVFNGQAVDSMHGHTNGPTVQRGADEWRELCYGLIGALAAVTLLALIYIIVTQVHARRHQSKFSEGHCRTVLSPTMRVFANGLLSNTDYQMIGPYADGAPSRRSRHWFLKHLRRSSNRAQDNSYSPEPEVALGAIPEVVEMARIQSPPLDGEQPEIAQGQGAQAQVQDQAPQGHAAQGHRLGSTQSWDSGISTHDGNRL